MRRAIAVLAAVAVLWHATVGCCACHGTARAIETSPDESWGAARTAACHHDHESGSPENPHHEHLPGAPGCHDDACVFSVPDAPQSMDFDLAAGQFSDQYLLTHQQGLAPAVAWERFSSSPPQLGSLARHLALGVLLL